MLWIGLALALAAFSILLRRQVIRGDKNSVLESTGAKRLIQAGLLFFAVLCIASTSYITIGPDEVGQLSRIYLAKPLPTGHIIALNGQLGPQAEILGPGFHFRFLLNVLNKIERRSVVEVPAGKYGNWSRLTASRFHPPNIRRSFYISR
jgi:hypothetical protein